MNVLEVSPESTPGSGVMRMPATPRSVTVCGAFSVFGTSHPTKSERREASDELGKNMSREAISNVEAIFFTYLLYTRYVRMLSPYLVQDVL
jgi:hypothetical protein